MLRPVKHALAPLPRWPRAILDRPCARRRSEWQVGTKGVAARSNKGMETARRPQPAVRASGRPKTRPIPLQTSRRPTGGEDVHQTVDHLAHVDRSLGAAALGGRDQRRHARLFLVRQIAQDSAACCGHSGGGSPAYHIGRPPASHHARKSQETQPIHHLLGQTLRFQVTATLRVRHQRHSTTCTTTEHDISEIIRVVPHGGGHLPEQDWSETPLPA